MNYHELRKSARTSLTGRWGLAAAAFFLFYFLNSPFNSLLLPFSYFYQITHIDVYDNSEIFALLFSYLPPIFSNAELVGERIDIIDIIWSIITYGGLYLGSIQILLAISRFKATSIRDLFTYFRSIKLYWRAFWAVALQAIYLTLWSLLVVPAIIKSFSYAMTNYILIDHPELSADEAITKSRKMMDGHKGQLFVLYLTFIWWALLGVLSLGIGFIWLLPYMEAASIQFYFKLIEENPVQINA